jgi:hypothetical protein
MNNLTIHEKNAMNPKSLVLLAMLGSVAGVHAANFISPEKVNSDVELNVGRSNITFCRVIVHNSVLDDMSRVIVDYVVGFGWTVSADDDKSRSMVLVSGKVLKHQLGYVSGKMGILETKQTIPLDMSVTVPSIPNSMRLERLSSDLISDKAYLGHPVGADGVTRNEDEQSVITAVMGQVPILVSMVMDNSLDGAKTMSVVDNLTKDKRDAFIECLQHANDQFKANELRLKKR